MSGEDSSPVSEHRDEVRDALAPPGYAVAFNVFGTPAPQSGSKSVPTPAGQRLITTGGIGLASWRRAVALEADIRRLETGTLVGALGLDVTFRFQMVQTRAKKASLREFNVIPHSTYPDLDKLCRAVFDGLQEGGLIRNDSQIASLVAFKCEVRDDWTGATVKLRRLEEARRNVD